MVNTSTQNSTGTVKTAKAKKIGSAGRKTVSTKSRTRAVKGGRRAADVGVAANLYQQGREAVAGVYESAAQASRALPKLSKNMHLRERSQSAYLTMERHPLVLGVVGLGVGMVLAALLPSMSSHRGDRSGT